MTKYLMHLILIAVCQPGWAENVTSSQTSFINLSKLQTLNQCQSHVARATARVINTTPSPNDPTSSYDLCPTTEAELGIAKPSDTHCTSFLVGPDLMLTNTHCVILEEPKLSAKELCKRLIFKFDQLNNLNRKKGIERACKEIIYSSPESIHASTTGGDFAFIRLNKPVTDSEYLKLEAFGKISEEVSLVDGKIDLIKSIEAMERNLTENRITPIPDNLPPELKDFYIKSTKTAIEYSEQSIESSKKMLDLMYGNVPTDTTPYPVFENKNLWIVGYPLGGDLVQSKITASFMTATTMTDLRAVTVNGSGFSAAGNSGSPMISPNCKVVGINFGAESKTGTFLEKIMKGFRQAPAGCFSRSTTQNMFTKSESLITILNRINRGKIKVINNNLPLSDSNRYQQEGLPLNSVYKK